MDLWASAKNSNNTLQLSLFADPSFTLKQFIDQITFEPLSQTKLGNAQNEFDSLPFINMFENALEDLIKYRKAIQREIDELEDENLAVENTYKDELNNMNTSLNEMYGAFNTLESRVVEVANTAVRIGEQLETIDKQRAKASDVKELLLFFMDFNMGVSDRLENLRTQPDGQINVAKIARRLLQVAKDVDAPGTEQARPGIEKYCEIFETDLLRQFLAAAEKRDIETMKVCSETLTEFNGGESCLKAWINQHSLFTASPIRVSQPFEKPDEPDPGFRKLLEQLYITLYQDWDIMNNVFSSPQTVLTTIIQRFFQQAVQNYLEQLMKLAADVSEVFYLKTLASNLYAAQTLAKDLAHFDETVLKKTFVSTFVERCVDEVFAVFTVTLEREQSLLNQTSQMHLSEAINYYNNRRQQKKSIFSRIQKPIAPLENMLSTDHVMQVLTVNAKSIERCRLIHSEPHLSASSLFLMLCNTIYVQYLELALDTATEEVQLQDGKVEPDYRSLLIVQNVNTIMHLMQAHFISIIVPVIAPFPPTHRDVVEKKTAMIGTLEKKCNSIVIHLLNLSMMYLQSILAKQKKTDFKHKEGEVPTHSLSPTCSSICEFLSKVFGHIQSYFDGENARHFSLEIGKQCHVLLLEHFKKFPVSNMGALTLSRDLAKYQEVISQFKISELNVRFSLLREIGNLFLVRPENLTEIVEEGLLASLDRGIIWAYLSNRTDFKTAKIDTMLHLYGSNDPDFSTDDISLDSLATNIALESEGKRIESTTA